MQLAEHEVHIYTADLTLNATSQAALFELLNEDERTRAMRFIAPIHQQRFIASHGLLRQLLSKYLNLQPQEINFAYSEHNKPSLVAPYDQALQFNLSHSGNVATYAFTRSGAIGIDIELLQTDAKVDVAERFFSPHEVQALLAAKPADQARMFYRLWSRKEAIIKANGKGLTQPLSSFSVATQDVAETVTVDDETWHLYPLDVHPDYAAALATSKSVQQYLCWDVVNISPTTFALERK